MNTSKTAIMNLPWSKKDIMICSMLLWMCFVLIRLAAEWQFAATAYWIGNR